MMTSGFLRKQVDLPGLLDGAGDLAMKLGGDSGHTTWQDLAGLGGELGEEFWIEVMDVGHLDVMPTAWHLAVRLAEGDTALDGFRLCGHEENQRSSR